ncbi:MAG: sulfotransferase [Desulfobacteraceae bacterium]|nr:MAG: sulfotransferase [Desulfobacteraceae bacterium]
MSPSRMQVLITGCYRSGTEYVTLLLNNHPDLAATMYVVNFMRFCYDRYNPIEVEQNYSKLIFDAAERIRLRWRRNVDVHSILDVCNSTEKVTYALLYDLLMADLFLKEDGKAWAEKTQLVWTRIPAFLGMFPAGKVIHVVRDPRSVLASFKKFTYAPEPAYLGAIFNCYDSMKSGLQFKSEFPENRYHLLKYEDVVNSPRETLTRLFDFLGFHVEHDLLSEKDWKDPLGNPWNHNSAFAPKDAAPSRFDKQAAVSRWEKNLSEDEISTCECVNSELMKTYGYERSGIIPDWVATLKMLLSDERLAFYLKRWATDGRGVEEFPTDPINPANWEDSSTPK